MPHQRRGFTLVELLVVLGIIALLVALLIPVVTKSRDSARTAQCLSNQKQIFAALKAFANDNKDQFPGTSGGNPISGPAASPAPLNQTAPSGITVGQAIGANEQYPQVTLEQSTKSALIVRGYLPNSSVFHCPERDKYPFNFGPTSPVVIFHYVFNQYFVGDIACDTSTYLPNWSTSFQKNYTQRTPVTYTRSKNSSLCVAITEDMTIDPALKTYTDSVFQNWSSVPMPKRPDGSQPFDRIRCAPIHNRRANKKADFYPNIIYDYANCTFLDGHAESVWIDTTGDPGADGQTMTKYFSAESDTAGLQP
jgi:prepilin-type N-terminal cleavage/methylation domain-containing protein/prepilin-type processing-associated H-X9-DG protein